MKPSLNFSPCRNSSSLGRGLGRCRRDVKRTLLALCLLASPRVSAQSEKLLEGIRYGREEAQTLAGQELAACAKNGCARLKELSLLVGYLELVRGDAEAAARVLQARTPPASLEPFHGYYLGVSLFYSGRPRPAAATLQNALKGAPPWLESRIRVKLGEAWFEAGEAKAACVELERVTGGSGSPELYYRRARCRSALGNATGAKADWEVLALSFPAHPYAQTALSELSKPPAPWRASLEDRLRRGRTFLQSGDAASCLLELDRAEKDELVRGEAAEGRWSVQRVACLYAAGRAEDAEREILRVSKRGPSNAAAEAQLQRARHTLRRHDNLEAQNQMARLAADFPDEGPAREAAYLAGWLELQLGKYEEAIKTFNAHEHRRPGAGRSDDVIWLGAWARIRLGRYAEAQAKLLDLESTFPRSDLLPQVRYWTARCQQYVSSAKEAAPLYQRVIDLHPQTLYGTLSRERLRENGTPGLYPFGALPPAVQKQEERETAPPSNATTGLELAQALARTGLLRDASRELNRRVTSVKGTDAALKLGATLQGMGEYGFAHATAARALWGAAYAQRVPEALSLLYPQAFEQAVRAAAKEESLDPFWIWSLMRRESAFRPDVTSAADARGLMQMIPKTARAVAEALSLPEPEPGDLYRPELNVRLAAWYLAALKKRFGHPALIAAAYNAGPSAVLRWLEERGNLPMDAFIEEIPYKETRAYVKQVWADYYLYHALYGTAASRPLMDLVVPKAAAAGVEF